LTDAWVYTPATAQDGGFVNLNYPNCNKRASAEVSKYVSFPYLMGKVALWSYGWTLPIHTHTSINCDKTSQLYATSPPYIMI